MNTEIEKLRIENLKRFPESIIRVERRTVAICDRCRGEIPINHICLISSIYADGTPCRENQKRCPHCNGVGFAKTLSPNECFEEIGQKFSDRVIYKSVKHKIYHITEYILKETKVKTGWFSSKIVTDSVIEYTESNS